MFKKINRKGFTLIELLAVIVILGVVMAIAIPTYNTQIAASRKNGFVSSAKLYLSAIKDQMLAEGKLTERGTYAYSLNTVELSRGGKSPYDSSEFKGYVIAKVEDDNSGKITVKTAICIEDNSHNYLQNTQEQLDASTSTTQGYVKINQSSSPCSASGNLTNITIGGTDFGSATIISGSSD